MTNGSKIKSEVAHKQRDKNVFVLCASNLTGKLFVLLKMKAVSVLCQKHLVHAKWPFGLVK